MDLNLVAKFLAWCTVFNFGILIFWAFLIIFARDLMYSTHKRWYRFNEETMDKIHYKGILYYKMMTLFFNLIPYLIIRIFILK